MKIIVNNTPILIYWNYTEFWNQHGNKEVKGITVRCFVKQKAGDGWRAYKEIVKNIKNSNGYTNEDKAKGRRDTLEMAVKLLFGGVDNKENRRLIWNTYLKEQKGNINGTRKSTKNIIKEMKGFTQEQMDIIFYHFFNKVNETDARIVEMHNKIANEMLEA